MISADMASSVRVIWEHKPESIGLLILVFVVFLFVVVDTWRHKRRRRRRGPRQR